MAMVNGEARSLPDMFLKLLKVKASWGFPRKYYESKSVCSSANPARLEIMSRLLKIMRFIINKSTDGISACVLTVVVLGEINTGFLCNSSGLRFIL